MRRALCCILIAFMFMVSCSKESSNRAPSSGVQELALQQRVSGKISEIGAVNWYHFRTTDPGSVVQVRCTSETLRPDVELLVTLYELDENGNKKIIYGDHAPEKSLVPANLTLKALIDQPRDIYIAVRDYKDDKASDEPYFLSIDYAGRSEGNDTISQATALSVGSASCPSNTVGYVGDTDCFRFTSSGGIYDVSAVFSPMAGSPVQLSVALYDGSGRLIESQSSPGAKSYHLIHYLNAGEYHVLVSDYGKDHFDNASSYQVCVSTAGNAESNANDTAGSATAVNASLYGSNYTISGSLDYTEDRDFYRIVRPSASSGFQVLHLGFTAATRAQYTVSILDANSSVVYSRTYSGGASELHTQIKLGSGNYYILVQGANGQKITQSAPYTATVRMLDIVDSADTPPSDNGTIGTAIPLTFSSSQGTQGKISYLGDVDWYNVTIPPHAQPQILEVYFSAGVSEVEYSLGVMGAQLMKTLTNPDAETAPTSLKTSLLIPASASSAVYSFRAYDFRDDEGSDVTYTIRVDLKDIPLALPALADGTPPYGSVVNYCNEAAESSQEQVTLELDSVTRRLFNMNTTLLGFSGATIQNDTPQAGLITLTLPWIAGYVDYQGDQDWFLLDLDPLDSSTSWYFDMFVDFYAPASDVEYVWKFYPDRNKNSVVADRISGSDGFVASAGKQNNVPAVLNLRTPSAGETRFWAGNPWQGQTYFSIGDFNYLYNPDGSPNLSSDDDWGGYGSAPYYFRVTLIYHPGVSYPQP